jgi:excinuclease ABC subunit A
MCPTTGISYQNPELICFLSTLQKEPVIIARTGNGKRNQYKEIIQIKIIIKAGGFAPLGEYKSSWIFKQLKS